jgi:hypothetical protein
MIHLLPGEKMVIKDKNNTMIFDSHSRNNQEQTNPNPFGVKSNGFPIPPNGFKTSFGNPPNVPNSFDYNNNLIASFKKKNFNNMNGGFQFPPIMNSNPMMNGGISNLNNLSNNFNQGGYGPQQFMNNQNVFQGFQQNAGMNQGYNGQAQTNQQQFQSMNSNNNLMKPNTSPNFSFKQKENSSADDVMKKELQEMKAQFNKMMVKIILI